MTLTLDDRQRALATDTRAALIDALGDRLLALVLHGGAHGGPIAPGELALLIVARDLELATLARLRAPLRRWRARGNPAPRLFTPALLASSADIYPLELLELGRHREVLHGADPLVDVAIDDAHLRIQCEREIVEKLMRLREAYAEHRRPRDLERLASDSYPDFTRILRGVLHLAGRPIPADALAVARAFCDVAGLDDRAFVEVDALRRGRRAGDPEALFARYHAVLEQAADLIDRHAVPAAPQGERS
jgi:hypothetical protein